MVHSKKMKKGGVIRVIIFILLVLFVCYLCIAYNYDLYKETMLISISDERVDLDGADFSFLFMMMGGAINSMLCLFYLVVSIIVILIYSLIAFLIFGVVGLSKKSSINETECQIYQYSFYALLAFTVLISIIMSHGTNLLIILGLNVIWALFAYYFVLRRSKKLRDALRKQSEQ